jgi:hypothetical protein
LKGLDHTSAVLVEVRSPEDRQKQDNLESLATLILTSQLSKTYLLPLADLPKLFHFIAPRMLQNNLDFAAIGTLDLARRREEIGHRHSQTLESDEDQIGLRSHLSFAVARAVLVSVKGIFREMFLSNVLVQAKNNSTTHQRATCTEPKPDAFCAVSFDTP